MSLDEHKRIAVVYCTRGDGGGNNVGFEAGLALGQLREQEARRALGSLGIENVWFLTGADTPGQNPLRSLDRWDHGQNLDALVRLVRLTRPDVVLTWLPDFVVGENHGDHQAAGVIATRRASCAAVSQSHWPNTWVKVVAPALAGFCKPTAGSNFPGPW